eukprot:scaffold8371_cov71-Skeletonema_dohrnii-CCMP3373.AAC.1
MSGDEDDIGALIYRESQLRKKEAAAAAAAVKKNEKNSSSASTHRATHRGGTSTGRVEAAAIQSDDLARTMTPSKKYDAKKRKRS